MELNVPKGKYVAAVSGGVDSAVLLDLLSNLAGVDVVVAHFNHGIRPDSAEDEDFVRELTRNYGLPFESARGKLGAKASEERAREARYRFLNAVKEKYDAKAVITAHHQDDLLETAIINIIRGSGRRGLTAIADNQNVLRPLLDWPKEEILAYAKKRSLRWRDDPSNLDEAILRNYVRRRIIGKLSQTKRRQILADLQSLRVLNQDINQEIAKLSQNIISGKEIDRSGFTALPFEIAAETLMFFLRSHGISEFDKPTIERLAIQIKNAKPGTKHNINREAYLKITPANAMLDGALNR
jgi:tRNA(Ile)-lysidine synthase